MGPIRSIRLRRSSLLWIERGETIIKFVVDRIRIKSDSCPLPLSKPSVLLMVVSGVVGYARIKMMASVIWCLIWLNYALV